MTSAAMGSALAQVLNSMGSAVSLVVAKQHAAPSRILYCQATFGVALSRLLRPHKQGQPLAEALLYFHSSHSMPLTIQNIVSHALERAAMPMSAGMHNGTFMPMVQR